MKTSYGLYYELTREISPDWDRYHISVAKSHLENWNWIIVDEICQLPIDNEYDLAAIEEEAGL